MPYFRNQDNLRLYYEYYNGQGMEKNGKTPIVLLHGFGSSAHFFQEQINILRPDYKLLMFDAEGHGKSDKRSEEDLTDRLMRSMVSDLLELMYVLGIDQQIGLIGHSLVGGGLAQQLAILFPQKIKFLILLNSGTMVIDNPIRNVFWNLLPQMVRMNFNQMIKENIEDILDKTIPFIKGALLEEDEPSQVFHMKLDGIIEREIFDMIENSLDPSAIECPTLVIGGELDNYAPVWMSKNLAKKIPDSRLEIITMAGHFGPAQRADAYNELIWSFLQKVD